MTEHAVLTRTFIEVITLMPNIIDARSLPFSYKNIIHHLLNNILATSKCRDELINGYHELITNAWRDELPLPHANISQVKNNDDNKIFKYLSLIVKISLNEILIHLTFGRKRLTVLFIASSVKTLLFDYF